ncbi:MAG TPA: DUF6522 family protein [Amaricoccus sp.]|uniref:DUF6522 family protein n=1 Tax=Amaricoccus sp. TaxID=1872485 RepID=UPI002C01B30A|nr:DUF6522 family protein [Amaricoccus sp.]HMQ93705.1 DUF6522 family protein [Amaricoccus sp.]HMR52822.1 DUF6522 family protein [Amaricoccus sp.]HMR60240.1 DUF6522 family protein [Amaricoccus sp.]HMT99757.1 DUF6522 family protein [Amaricoccus sp.]
MGGIERDGEGFVVPAGTLAEAFGVSEEEIREKMRAEKITSRSEIGVGEDEGLWRLTFIYGDRACRFIVDGTGRILKRVGFPTRTRTAGPIRKEGLPRG